MCVIWAGGNRRRTDRGYSLRGAELSLRAFGLTAAEVRTALKVASVDALSDIAGQLHLSRETVRGHVKSIFSKLDIHKQTELAILVSRLGPPGVSD